MYNIYLQNKIKSIDFSAKISMDIKCDIAYINQSTLINSNKSQ